MKIRKATKKDLKEISNLFRIESAKRPYFQKWTQKTALEKITNSFKKDDIHIVMVEKKIVGFIISRIRMKKGKEVYVDEFWLKPDYQRKGVGKILLKFIEDKYKKRGISRIGLVANRKAGAVHFYKKLKYKVEQEFFYMAKKLK